MTKREKQLFEERLAAAEERTQNAIALAKTCCGLAAELMQKQCHDTMENQKVVESALVDLTNKIEEIERA